jgi:pyruvate dehydrogenase E2 component (dihydrolipoamide acetyltransferase)
MAIEILMPALSPTMEEGKLAKWLVKEGDSVAAGDVIAEIETDKATMEVEATDEGVVAKILVAEGTDEVPVNAVIAVLAEEGEDAASVEIPAAAPAPAAKPAPEEKREEKPSAAPAPAAPAQQAQTAAPVYAQTATPASETQRSGQGGRIFATPLARRLAKEAGIDLALISGSGPRGRIIKADVERAIKEGVKAPAAASSAAPLAASAMSDEEVFALYPQGSYDLVPLDSMRKVIAERLTASKQTIPHFYLSVDCALDRLLEARAAINASAPKDEDGKPAWKLSVNDFIIKAWALALMRVPEANATWSNAGIMLHHHADVAVAVAIEGGLITPVIRKAEEKTLSAISKEMKDLAARARARKLMPEEYTGGATSISNLGMFGVKQFAAVINPPHATILAVGKGEPRPVAENGEVVIRTIMTATLSVDHRAVDGALGARALAAFKALIEEPALMLA